MALRKKTGATEAREKLFDRVFKPQEMLLPNGHSVMRPRSRLPLIWGVILIAIAWALWFTGFDVSILIERGYQFGVILKRVFTPDMSYLDKVWSPLFDTIKMSVIGSVLGSTLALPFAVLASTNINKSRGVVAVLRVVLNIVRTLPTLVIASIFALIFGLGTFAGTVAITVFTFGIVAKMLYESIETIDMGRSRPWSPWARTSSARSGRPAFRRYCPPTSPSASTALRSTCARRRSWAMWVRADLAYSSTSASAGAITRASERCF